MCAINLIFAYKDFRVVVSEKSDNLIKLNKNSNFLCNYELNHYLTLPNEFTAKDEDFLITLLYFAKKNKMSHLKNKITLSFDDLKKFLDEKTYKKNNNRFYKEICNFIDKISLINGAFILLDKKEQKYKSNFITKPFTLFKQITYNIDEKKVIFEISQDTYKLLFFIDNFLQLDLKELCNIKSKSSKAMYRIFIQFKNLKPNKDNLKILNLNISEFRKFFKPSSTYSTKDIDKRILKPAIEELVTNKYFKSIKYEKIKEKLKIYKYQFYFDDSNRVNR